MRPLMFTALDHWFDQELKRAVGLDVYRTAFPYQKGYAIYENQQARVLLYRLEALSKLPNMIHQFLGCDVPAVVQRNVASTKRYANQYAFVRQHLRLPSDFVAERFRTKIMEHFYSSGERQRFASQWMETSSEPRAHALDRAV